jgi:hypothetical protein
VAPMSRNRRFMAAVAFLFAVWLLLGLGARFLRGGEYVPAVACFSLTLAVVAFGSMRVRSG